MMTFLPVLALSFLPSAPDLTLERIFADPPLEGRAPVSLELSPGGKYVTFLAPNALDSDILDLWGAQLPGGKPAILVASETLLGGKAQKLTEQEKMALERKRITKKGITSYLWCGRDAGALVFPLSGDLYYVRLDGTPAVRLTQDEDVPELNPVCDGSGEQVAFVKKGEVVVMHTTTRKTRQLTRGAGATKTFGLPEFIAEEEMDRHEGMWWAPDGKSLIVFEVDEAPVDVKTRAQIFADRTAMFEQRYPAAGEKNAAVTAWIVRADDVNGRHKVRLQTPSEDGYLPRAGFFPDGRPWIQWQSRDQTRLVLYEADARGALRKIHEETDAAWVELHDDLHVLADGKRILWSSEASGRRQLVLLDRASGAVTPLTNEPEPVESLAAVDDARGVVFYRAWRDRGRQLQVFALPLATPEKAAAITVETGWHAARFDDRGTYFVDKFSDYGRPPVTVVRDASGQRVFVVDENPATELQTYARPTPEWLDLKAADGTTVLNGLLLPPTRLEPGKRYPVITSIYGGPGSQTAIRSWQRGYLTASHWAGQGFGVFLVDNRGMAGRDRVFTRGHYRAFGDIEVRDLFAAVQQLKAVPWVDGGHIGVFGWSYGGFLAARAMLDPTTPFAAGAAVAPVTDWTGYDTHYTERFLGMPKDNAAYASANLVTRAKLLERPLLLMHGTADDNVLFEHTLRLIEALEKEGKRFDLMIYPGKAHGISGKPSQLHVYRTITSFFARTLR